MAGMYLTRHPERTVLYRVLFHQFERFLAEYEGRFEREYGFLRPVVKNVQKLIFRPRRKLIPLKSTSASRTSNIPDPLGSVSPK